MANTSESGQPAAPTDEERREHYRSFVREVEARAGAGLEIVLLVDDEVAVRRFLRRSIHRAARSVLVHEAENGREALRKLDEIREKHGTDPLLIVADLQMPIMDGFAFIEHLREEYVERGDGQGIPIIAFSATRDEQKIIFSRSVQAHKSQYRPLVNVPKEVCLTPEKHHTTANADLTAWVREFLARASS